MKLFAGAQAARLQHFDKLNDRFMRLLSLVEALPNTTDIVVVVLKVAAHIPLTEIHDPREPRVE